VQGSRANTGQIAADLALFDTLVTRKAWPVAGGGVNPLGKNELAARLIGIDTNFRMFDIHDYLRSVTGDRLRAVRGDESVAPTQLYRMTKVERNARTGEAYAGGLELWGICSHIFREQLIGLFDSTPGQPGAWQLPADIYRDEDYLRQVVNRVPVTEVNSAGKKVVRWRTRDRLTGEHFFDCEVINLALANMVTGGDWDLSRWATPAAKPKHATNRPSNAPNLPRDHESFEAR
jgi:phage terminase large subunit GpA-like protein